MNLFTILDMAASGFGDRQALGRRGDGPTYADLRRQAAAGGAWLAGQGAGRDGAGRPVVFVGQSGHAFASAFFACNWADVPFVPLNYRLAAEQLEGLIDRTGDPVVVAEPAYAATVAGPGRTVLTTEEWLAAVCGPGTGAAAPGGDAVAEPVRPALHLFTSGTTAEPKAAILGHDNLSAYILGSVDFGAAGEEEAALVSVPPYHIAGVANLLSNVFAGRRIVYLAAFDPASWLEVVRTEGITQAMVVPTMLARITEALAGASSAGVPTLRSISYGGARMPVPVLERALQLFSGTGFVNAYGLTETSSSIAVLGPDDHRRALAGDDPVARDRLGSVGRVLPGIEVQVRGPDGSVLGPGDHGEIWVRGEQVSGRYAGLDSPCDPDGWFPTRDAGWVDADGYLFVEGRADDTIIRGGENIAPAEIEEVLLRHPAVVDAAVVGLPDEEWGQRIGAMVVLRPADGGAPAAEDIAAWSRAHLRTSKAAEVVVVRDALPRTDTGKLLRRQVLADLLEVIG
ncbi:MAG TPA: long-chain fatty acid--CoA ligase [Acidimicrobiales bacterium]|nr:long-chain fatty acid--CoA ligase [Acidimicrobiales bacterium]